MIWYHKVNDCDTSEWIVTRGHCYGSYSLSLRMLYLALISSNIQVCHNMNPTKKIRWHEFDLRRTLAYCVRYHLMTKYHRVFISTFEDSRYISKQTNHYRLQTPNTPATSDFITYQHSKCFITGIMKIQNDSRNSTLHIQPSNMASFYERLIQWMSDLILNSWIGCAIYWIPG